MGRRGGDFRKKKIPEQKHKRKKIIKATCWADTWKEVVITCNVVEEI